MKKISFGIMIFSLGAVCGSFISLVTAAEPNRKPAFLIVSSDRNEGVSNEDYAPYLQAAGPLAVNAGLTMTAGAQSPLVLEGSWPYKNIAIERFDSMQAVRDFWFSDGYQAAKKLREGLSTVNFIVAVEGNAM